MLFRERCKPLLFLYSEKVRRVERLSLDLIDFMQEVAPPGVGIYGARLLTAADGYHFEVVLDGLEDPVGAVTLDDCEDFSRRLTDRLDRTVEEREHESGEDRWIDVLPAGLTIDNYSLEVSSAGAERELRLPEELERFRGQPLKLRLRRSVGGNATETDSTTVEVRLGVFESREESADEERYVFREYVPSTSRVRRREGRRSGRSLKKSKRGAEEVRFVVGRGELAQANLYLDF